MPAHGTPDTLIANQIADTAPSSVFDTFLNRLMTAESGGRRKAKNPRSTALGPFQFIKSTFLDVTRRHFPAEIVGLTEQEVLSRRTDPDLAWRAAAAFCRDNVKHLKDRGLEPTFAHLRLSFLLGPADAVRIIQSREATPVVNVLSEAIIEANPFMRDMKVADLLSRSERDVNRDRNELVETAPQPQVRPPARVRAPETRVAKPAKNRHTKAVRSSP
jgi:hypothetical protein